MCMDAHRQMPSRLTGLMLMLILAVLLGGCQNADPWPTIKDDALAMPGNLLDESKEMINKPENIAILLVGGGASGYVRCAHDDEIEDHFEGHHTFPRDFTIAQGAIGSPISHFGLATAGYAWSLAADDAQGRTIWLSTLEALSLNGLLTTGLKVIAQDHSPNGESLAWPSGHTSSSVTLATVMNEYYGPWVGIPLYALSGFVMYERMETGEHWASDVVFGAALGYVVGKTVADRYKPEIFGMEVAPYMSADTGATGIALYKRF
ncbi:MAG: phosphatase PAP2 family protein [Sedimentisphaerales bacterium]|nr:phosphatase PAP2 family protein [Sedimentisphaerales bacterium]